MEQINNKSTLFLIIAIAAAILVTLWIILSFDNQSNSREGLGQGKIQSIMVAESTGHLQRQT